MNRDYDSMCPRTHNYDENYISFQCIKETVSRPQLVANLCSELLGPISGRLEILPDWPDLVYSLGILAPKSSSDDLGELEDLSNISEGEFRSEDNEGDANVEAPPAPWIDPARKPSPKQSGVLLATWQSCIANGFDPDREYPEYAR